MQGLKNSVISRGFVVHARAQNAVTSRGSTYFNSQDFLHARVQNALLSKVLCMQGLKMQLFCESLCRNSNCFNFQDLAIFKVLCMQGSIYCNFRDFVHAGARRASLSRAVCTKGLQMLLEVLHFPEILCTQGFHMLQFAV